MADPLVLLPIPRRLGVLDGVCVLGSGKLILLQGVDPQRALFTAKRLEAALSRHCGLAWQIVASPATPAVLIGATLSIVPTAMRRTQGYRLVISPAGITLQAHDESGLFYGVCTLVEIVEQRGRSLPCLEVSDWPDFPARGVMLDISRDKVPTMDTLFALVDMLASWKINQLQLYTEHTFAYRKHPEVWAACSPVTGEEIMELDAYCRQRYVELVPNQNSFGHVEHWLIHPRYAPLGEGIFPDNTLCPTDPNSLPFVAGLYDELLPHFASRLFNVGCDETELGKGRSKEACRERGEGRVYLDFLLGIYREVSKRGHTMQFWGDIIMRHPELITDLPRDSIALEWGYDADHPFADHSARFAASGVPFYVCPGTSTWNTIAGRTDNALQNLVNAAENGLKNGAIGYLNTDWGDRGHPQALPVSFLGYAAGAAFAWALEANRNMDVPKALSIHGFGDATGSMGCVAYELGNIYKATGQILHNSTAPFHLLYSSLDQIRARFTTLTTERLEQSLAAIDAAMAPMTQAQMARSDAALIKDEYANSARMLRHGCRRGLLALGGASDAAAMRELDMDMWEIVQEYARLWLARNRSGGLADSISRLEKSRQDYRWTPEGKYPWW